MNKDESKKLEVKSEPKKLEGETEQVVVKETVLEKVEVVFEKPKEEKPAKKFSLINLVLKDDTKKSLKVEEKKEEKKDDKKEKKTKEKSKEKQLSEKNAKKTRKEYTSGLFRPKLSITEQVHFAKRLAFLIRSGVPVLESLQILTKQAKSSSRKKIFNSIEEDVANGRPLSQALGRFRDSFGDFTISVVRIGEMSGTLSKNLTYLAEELQKRQALKRKIIGAMVYPAFITVATVGVTALLTVYIFPKVMPIFMSMNVTLPFTTKALLFISNFLRDYGLYALGAVIAVSISMAFVVRKSKPIHYFINRNMLRPPVLGTLIQHYNMANFCRTMSLLLRSGFNVVEAATVTSESTSNPVYKLECYSLHKHVIKGEKISKYLDSQKKLFPDIVSHMVTIGETSGTLSDTLMYLAEHYEAELDDMVKNLSNSIEPVLMVFMGVLVGFVAVSVITPIYEVTQHLSR